MGHDEGKGDWGHLPVMPSQVVELLRPRNGGRYLDGTLGMGGHTEQILKASGGEAEVLGLDRDEAALATAERRLGGYKGKVHLWHGPFSRFEDAMRQVGWNSLDGALVDLGVSSLQLDTAERGFSFLRDGPLDMRMDPSAGAVPASALVNKASFQRLAEIIGDLGEDPLAGRIARAIVAAREEAPIETTARLAAIVEQAYPAKWRRTARNHPATRTFQGLRMAVNDELGELDAFLSSVIDYLAPGGRLAVISFHSLEDRMVKRAFKREAQGCICPPRQPMCTCDHKARVKILTKKPLTASDEEQAANPRSRSAKLRGAERLADA
ncbi:Ribosomal RNA small subunit methyltransferase H [Desulfovibrio sp. X2]|uniref:16S rRNA (cytosine(1402)-N(4))-methyltransferase RsmH n=1 Tax=Desulfovibrio sp. X2 TaxID=941449 RepID=UPI000358A319|nr:16S rRNA (cytosine(1402)-N(4))-methyltransferase RsmH [Desulfovibrio sp. X2]EPR44456.1 Ribosomal RNA small subunit methyltransferase H [Desulfovibrio sp. X2]